MAGSNMQTTDRTRLTLLKLRVFSSALVAVMISATLAHAAGAATPARKITHSSALGAWAARLAAQLNEQKRLPAGVVGAGGTAKVAFRIDRAGNVLFLRLVQSTGQAARDEEALGMVKRAQPFPAPPEDIGEDHLKFIVPIAFQGSPSICRGC
jgi:TonB family protein